MRWLEVLHEEHTVMAMATRRLRNVTLVLLGTSVALVGLCAACPLSNSLILRPLLARFDSRYMPGSTSEVGPMPFDRELWHRGRALDRVGMAEQFVRDNSLNGKARGELIDMFGEPDFDQPGDEGLRWRVGFVAKGMFDETVWLAVTILDDGTATGACLCQDWNQPKR